MRKVYDWIIENLTPYILLIIITTGGLYLTGGLFPPKKDEVIRGNIVQPKIEIGNKGIFIKGYMNFIKGGGR